MFNRIGHLVEIISGPDKSATGKIIEIDDDIIYVEKSDGNFKEMYDNHNVFGFYTSDIKVIEPCIKSRDKVKVLDSTDSPDIVSKEGTVKSVKDGTAKVVIDGKSYDIPFKSLFLIDGRESSRPTTAFSVKVFDIVIVKRGTRTMLCQVIDKSGISYEVRTMHDDRYEVKRNQILKKFTVKQMLQQVVKPKSKVDSNKARELYKSLAAIRKIDDRNQYEIQEYKQALQRKIKEDLSPDKDGIVKFDIRGKQYSFNRSSLRDPIRLKQAYWNFLKHVEAVKRQEVFKKRDSMFGVNYDKQGKVYTTTGLFSKLNKKLKDRDLIHTPKSPFTKSKYVGIEIEMFSNYDRNKLNDELTNAGLGRNISLCNDMSIKDYGDKYPIEVRVLATERSLPNVMERTLKVLADANAEVNKTCGLHVHLDMRNRNVSKAYKNLVNAQDFLFKAVDKKRAENQYCKPVNYKDFKTAIERSHHYDAISAEAYRKHKSLEIRMHEGTLDKDKILNWVNILIGIADNKSVQKQYEPERFVKQLAKVSQEDKDYFKNRLAA